MNGIGPSLPPQKASSTHLGIFSAPWSFATGDGKSSSGHLLENAALSGKTPQYDHFLKESWHIWSKIFSRSKYIIREYATRLVGLENLLELTNTFQRKEKRYYLERGHINSGRKYITNIRVFRKKLAISFTQ
jgi:hypothetical protein